jgi:UDP-N-acetylmuramoyl-L-alanyl-D-glutamate--2,6-diaminopimelate ligase
MRLRELFDGLGEGQADPDVTTMALDSRTVTAGTLFCCVPGFEADGHDFAAAAVEQGAVALLTERRLDLGVAEVVVDDVRASLAPAAARLNGNPTAALEMVGITGTNGKTTSAFLTRALLEAGGKQSGLLGSVKQIVGRRPEPSFRTTPEAIDLQRCFAAMLAAGDDACTMEVSSHAIRLHRVDAIDWDVAIFTNLSYEHLDFHEDMEDYFDAKASLFRDTAAQAVINIDDAYGQRLADEISGAITIGVESADAELRALPVQADARSTRFTIDGLELTVPLPGQFNLLNALGAVAAARSLGVDDASIATGLAAAELAPGRFEPINEGQGFAVIVDYAHTPDALANVLKTARQISSGRVIVLFGAGGDRDATRRPLMGAAASADADLIFLTSDNPRSEDPLKIIDQIAQGIDQGGPAVEIVVDRAEAISAAIATAEPDDVLLIAGRGHERWQELAGGERIEFEDAAVARDALRGRAA